MCMKYMFFIGNILFDYPQHVCNGVRNKVDTFIFTLSMYELKIADPALKFLTVAKVRSLPWKHMAW